MRSIAFFLGFLIAANPMVAHAKKYKVDLTAGSEQQSRMNNGIESIDSNLASSSVRIYEIEETFKKRGKLQIYILNAGENSLNFGPENVSIETEDGKPVAVVPYETLLKEEQNRQKWRAFAAGLAAASNSINAANSGYSYGTVNAYGSGGWVSGNYSTYNPAAASLATNVANQQNQQMFDRLALNNAVAMEALQINMRTSTVDPEKDFGGQVSFELPKQLRSSKKPSPIVLKVRVGEEEHVFRAMLQPVK